MTVLVTGATGNVGRNVVDLLLGEGVPVRATSRNPQTLDVPAEVDVCAADLDAPDTFVAALDGVDKVFLFPSPAGARGFVEAAKTAGVQHIVVLSSLAAMETAETSNPISERHIVVEKAVEDSGIPWTFVRPGAFATNTFRWVKSIKDDGGARISYAQANVSPIHERDIAAVAVTALTGKGHEGAVYPLTGPESITQARQVELIGKAIGRALWIEDLIGDDAKAALAADFGPYAGPEIIETMLGYFKSQLDTPAFVTDTVEKVIGRPAATFAEWAHDHAGDFR
jgi:uncharacterized protein YbjT (DUF2867 family)